MNAQVEGNEYFNDYELIFSCSDFLTGVSIRVKRQNKNWMGLDDIKIMETSSFSLPHAALVMQYPARRQQMVYRCI